MDSTDNCPKFIYVTLTKKREPLGNKLSEGDHLVIQIMFVENDLFQERDMKLKPQVALLMLTERFLTQSLLVLLSTVTRFSNGFTEQL